MDGKDQLLGCVTEIVAAIIRGCAPPTSHVSQARASIG